MRPKEFPRHRDTLGQIRASTTRPAKALPSTWRGPVQNQSVAKMIWTAAKVVSRKADDAEFRSDVVNEIYNKEFMAKTK